MPKTVKTLLAFTIVLLILKPAGAQLKLPVTSPVITDLKRVVADYPNQYNSLIGDEIATNPQSVDYRCNFVFHDAEFAQFTRYSSAKSPVTSFLAQLLVTDDFDKARQKYKTLCSQLNNLSMSAGAAGSFRIKGQYEAPAESSKFNSVLFAPENGSTAVQNLRVEVLLEAEQMEWTVKLLVYDYQKGDAERGPVHEGSE